MSNFGFGKENLAGKKFIPVGLAHENVELVKVELVKIQMKTGNQSAICFNFRKGSETLDGKLLQPNKFYLKDLKTKDGGVFTVEQQFENNIREFNSYLREVALEYGVSEENLAEIPGGSFDDVIKEYCRVVNQYKNPNTRCYLKVVANKNGYSTIPNKRPIVLAMGKRLPGDWVFTPGELKNINKSLPSDKVMDKYGVISDVDHTDNELEETYAHQNSNSSLAKEIDSDF